MNSPSVTLDRLTIGYQAKGNTKTVATDLNAFICEGELTCLLGANGVGKSTLLRTLATFQPPLSGSITIDGKALDTFDSRQLSQTIGVVLTEKPDIHNMSVSELVGLGRSPYTGFWGRLSRDDEKIVSDSIDKVGIAPLASRLVDTLSDGERQKVMIAKALAQQTPIILLDEPTAFLDYPSKADMMQLLRQLAHDMRKTIFLSTHDLELALQIADTIWLMEGSAENTSFKQSGNSSSQQNAKLTVGTPRQLADDGTLSRFINHGNIVFAPQTLSIRIG